MIRTEPKSGTTELNSIDSRGSFHEPRANLGIVLSTEISRMPEILKAIEQIPGTRIIYHRASLGRLYIVPEEKQAQGYDGGDPRREP